MPRILHSAKKILTPFLTGNCLLLKKASWTGEGAVVCACKASPLFCSTSEGLHVSTTGLDRIDHPWCCLYLHQRNESVGKNNGVRLKTAQHPGICVLFGQTLKRREGKYQRISLLHQMKLSIVITLHNQQTKEEKKEEIWQV